MGHVIGSDGPGAWRRLDQLVEKVVHNRAAMGFLQAAEAALLAEAVELVVQRSEERRALGRVTDNDLPLREVAAELGAAMRLSDRTVQARMGDASTLVTAYPATWEALRRGCIDAGHVSAILDGGTGITDDVVRARYERQALDAAPHESPARLRSLARAIAARIDPRSAEERRKDSRSRRAVRIVDLDDDMARVLADVPAVLAYAIYDRLTQGAILVRGSVLADAEEDGDGSATAVRAVSVMSGVSVTTGSSKNDSGPDSQADEPARDTRSMDELRADIFCDLILTGAPTAHGDRDALGAISARVQVTLPVLTVAGVGDEPALLAGYGPIDVETALRLAAKAPGWDRVMTHPHTGAPLAVDRYHPGAELRRFIDVRDEHCRCLGCSMPVWRCDADHTVDAALGGPTSHGNLANLCRRHHTLKHASEWKVRQLGGGVLEWTSLTGRKYLDRPPMTVRFVPDPDFGAALGSDPPPF
jgi:hypothetical protein